MIETLKMRILKTQTAFILVVSLCIFSLISYQTFTRKLSVGIILSSVNETLTFINPGVAIPLMEKYRTNNGDFQLVSHKNKTLVYSAYIDGRSDKIRVMGITMNKSYPIYCVFWYNNITNGVKYRMVEGQMIPLAEHHNHRYAATYILCYLLGNDLPDAVSIVDSVREREPSNILPVHRTELSKTRHEFAVCVSPLQNGYDKKKELIEWLETIQLQGITSVTFYLQNTTNEIITVLKYYEQIGLVKTLPWSLPPVLCIQKKKQLHYCGQILATNDCIYRYKGRGRFVSSFDLDELIVPQRQEDYTWAAMLNKLPRQCVYLFRNAFFGQSENGNKETSNSSETLRIMNNQAMDDFIYGPRDRSKWIIRTDCAVVMGIHQSFAVTSRQEYKYSLFHKYEYTVPVDIGLLHHYRVKPVKYPDGVTVTKRHNNAAGKYYKQLQPRVGLMEINVSV